MFETAETGSRVDKDTFKRELLSLRVDLLNVQYDLQDADFSVVVLVAGDDRPACELLLDRFHEWMDARLMETHAYPRDSDEEQDRPWFWRYWRTLPPKGRIGLYLHGWCGDALVRTLTGDNDEDQFRTALDHIAAFERALADDGALVLKFWLHLPRQAQKARLKKARKHPEQAWRLEPADWDIYEAYDQLIPLAEDLLRQTDTGRCPWHVVESTDGRYRDLTVMQIVRAAVTERMAGSRVADEVAAGARPDGSDLLWNASGVAAGDVPVSRDTTNVLDRVDLTLRLRRKEYRKRLHHEQARLAGLMREARAAGVSSVLVFEGWDAAGKGGAIRRITGALPARDYRVAPVSAPTDEERARHYLWRFWRLLPRAGQMLIFDRSWYGRVLVERVEGFATVPQWRRAYREANDFESQVVEHGVVLLKFWLHVDPEEQLRRFHERQRMPYKKYKITEEDFRNRQRWPAYIEAVNEMVARTSTRAAPWHLVPANSKRWARVQVLETVNDALAQEVARKHRQQKG